MKKRNIIIAVAASLAVLTGCSDKNNKSAENTSSDNSSVTVTEAVTEITTEAVTEAATEAVTVTKPAEIIEYGSFKVIIDEVDDTEEYQYVEDTPTEFTDEQLLNRMDENTREWADRAGIVFEQTTDGSVTAQNALKAIQERFPTLTFYVDAQCISCEEYDQELLWSESPYASMTAEEVYAEMTAKYGTDPHCLDSIPPEEWVKDIIPLRALTMLME